MLTSLLSNMQAKFQVDEQARQRADAAAAQQVAAAVSEPVKGPDPEATTKASPPEKSERSQVHAVIKNRSPCCSLRVIAKRQQFCAHVCTLIRLR